MVEAALPLAAKAVTILAPFLPKLIKNAPEPVQAATQAVADKARQLWSVISPAVENDPMAKGAAEALAQDPNNQRAVDSLQAQLDQILESNSQLKGQVGNILGTVSDSQVQTIIADRQSVAAAGDVTGTFTWHAPADSASKPQGQG